MRQSALNKFLFCFALLMGVAQAAFGSVDSVYCYRVRAENFKYDTCIIGREASDEFRAELIRSFILQGFVSFDEVNALAGDTLHIGFNLSNPYKKLRVKVTDVDTKAQLKFETIMVNELVKSLNALVNVYAEDGFAFAECNMEEIEFATDSGLPIINCSFSRGERLKFESPDNEGSLKLNHKFLESHFNWKSGEWYKESANSAVDYRVRDLGFAKQTAASRIVFYQDKARLILNLAPAKSNVLDGMLGFMPNEEQQGKLTLTGEAKFFLSNLFERGHQLGFHWNRIRENTQQLQASYAYPKVLGSVFDFKGDFKLRREDTSFYNLNLGADLGFSIGLRSKMLIGMRRLVSSGLGSVSGFEGRAVSGGIARSEVQLFSLGYTYGLRPDVFYSSSTDYAELKTSIGRRGFKSGSDSVTLNTDILQFSGAYYRVRKVRSRTGIIKIIANLTASDRLFLNEVDRLGGLNSIRGFNENFFFAQHSAIATYEERFFFNESNYFALFTDHAVLAGKFSKGYVFSAGFGLGLELGGGLLQVLYAMGNSREQAIGFSSAKLHLGYSLRF